MAVSLKRKLLASGQEDMSSCMFAGSEMSYSHTVIDYQGGGEAHDIRYRHEGNELRQVHKQFWGHSRELVDESSSHCFHGLQLFLRGLTKTKVPVWPCFDVHEL